MLSLSFYVPVYRLLSYSIWIYNDFDVTDEMIAKLETT